MWAGLNTVVTVVIAIRGNMIYLTVKILLVVILDQSGPYLLYKTVKRNEKGFSVFFLLNF